MAWPIEGRSAGASFIPHLTENVIAQLVGTSSLSPNSEMAAKMKGPLETLKRIPSSASLAPLDVREKQLKELGKQTLSLRQRALSLIALEREFLEASNKETDLGMELAEGIDLMEKCGVKAVNNGHTWVFRYILPSLLDHPEGFAFYFPLYMQLASVVQITSSIETGLALRMGWDPEKLRPLEKFIRDGVHHENRQVQQLAKGFLAMFEFNQKQQEHQTIITKELHFLIVKLIEKTSFFGDKELLSLLPICAPVLHQLLMCDLEDLYMLFKEQSESPESTRNEFRKEVYGPKKKWHAAARGKYIEEQNKFYSSLISHVPKTIQARKHQIFTDQVLLSENTFIKKDPYPVPPAVPAKKTTKASSAKVESSPATMAMIPPPSWLQNPNPFSYHRRVLDWLTMAKRGDDAFEIQRVKHGFHPVVDKLIREAPYIFQRAESRKTSYYMVAQFDFKNGRSERGIISYGTFGKDEKEKCYHRHFSQKRDDELLQTSIKKVFDGIDETLEDESSTASFEASDKIPKIEIDPLLGLIKIHDLEKGVVISIFKMPI